MNSKYKIFSLLIFAGLLLFSSCQYEDGPRFSLRSKKARAVNTWYIDKVYEEGVDKTDDYKKVFVNYKLEIKKDDNYVLTYRLLNASDYSEKGTWKFSDDRSKLLFTPSGTNQENAYTLLRLKNNEAWAKTIMNNKNVEIHLKD